MAVPLLVTDPGAPNANSYATLEEAVLYAEGLTGPAARAWLDAEEDVQRQTLITATRRLDQESYSGRRAGVDQALQWPRVGARDEDGRIYPADVVPRIVREAQVEIAIGYSTDADPFAGGDLDEYRAVKVGPISIDLRDGAKPGALPDQVRRLLRHVLRTGGSTVRLVRG